MYSRSAKGGGKGDPNRNPWLAKMHVNVLFRNYKMDENSRPRKQARLDTFLIPRRDEKSQR